MEWLVWGIILFLFFASFIGLVAPIIPSTPLILAGFLLYQIFIGEASLGWGFWLTMLALTVLSFVIDYVSSGLFVKRYGGSRGSFWAAILGVMFGPFLLGPFGLLLGPFLAVVLVELFHRQKIAQAIRVGAASVIGFLGGSLFRGLIHLGMIIWFFVLVF